MNGDLFAEKIDIPWCNEKVWNALLEASAFNWSSISPAIFGSLFQNVMTPKERRHLGAHYTTEDNILRVIRPLFLDELEAELDSAKSKVKLEAFHTTIAELTFFDPACGCGNFLVVTYREMRRLETECLRKLGAKDRNAQGQLALDLKLRCRVNVDQFYGIEIEEFPALIARTALYLADHLANRGISAEFGQVFARFPIPTSPHIHIANALRINWNDVLPADQCDCLYGNPPFAGLAFAGNDPVMKEDKALAFSHVGGHDKRIGRLDYVAAWYAAAIPYLAAGHGVAAFVSTNSITQGEQARTMGPFLENNGFEVTFAHRTFAWTSEARGQAHVHVVVIGFAPAGRWTSGHQLIDYPDLYGDGILATPKTINWYLSGSPVTQIAKHKEPLMALPKMTEGNRPEDGGGLILDDETAQVVRTSDPTAAKYIVPLISAREYLHGVPRWCLWLVDADPSDIKSSSFLHDRLTAVRDARLAAKSNTNNPARKKKLDTLAATPGLFTAIRQPTHRYLCAPRHSSENRSVVPMWMCSPSEIAHDSTVTIDGAPLWLFGIMQSAMYTAWLRTIAGRLKSDIRIAPDLAYNAFPFPSLNDKKREKIETEAQSVLDVREEYPDSCLADLYDPIATPSSLLKAHRSLDKAVDAAYGRHKHTGDESRLRVLFVRYAELTGGDMSLFDDD